MFNQELQTSFDLFWCVECLEFTGTESIFGQVRCHHFENPLPQTGHQVIRETNHIVQVCPDDARTQSVSAIPRADKTRGGPGSAHGPTS